jgi:hypothetical protein
MFGQRSLRVFVRRVDYAGRFLDALALQFRGERFGCPLVAKPFVMMPNAVGGVVANVPGTGPLALA